MEGGNQALLTWGSGADALTSRWQTQRSSRPLQAALLPLAVPSSLRSLAATQRDRWTL